MGEWRTLATTYTTTCLIKRAEHETSVLSFPLFSCFFVLFRFISALLPATPCTQVMLVIALIIIM